MFRPFWEQPCEPCTCAICRRWKPCLRPSGIMGMTVLPITGPEL